MSFLIFQFLVVQPHGAFLNPFRTCRLRSVMVPVALKMQKVPVLKKCKIIFRDFLVTHHSTPAVVDCTFSFFF